MTTHRVLLTAGCLIVALLLAIPFASMEAHGPALQGGATVRSSPAAVVAGAHGASALAAARSALHETDAPSWAAAASGGWTNLSGTVGPEPDVAEAAAMSYDSSAGIVLLVGAPVEDPSYAAALANQTSQTWSFQNGTWTNLTATAGTPPPAVDGAMLADDPADGGVVLFGGQYSVYCNHNGLNGSPVSNPPGANCSMFPGPFYYSFYPNSTWWFAGGHWTELAPAVAPPGRDWGGMAYDPSASAVVLFGGLAGQGQTLTLGDTWRFSGGNWTDLTPTLAVSPPPRGLAGLAWDASDSQLLLFGGVTYLSSPPFDTALGINVLRGDTWGFSHGAWSNLTASSVVAPADRWQFLMAPAPGGGVVLSGGNSYQVNWDDTWLFSNGSWSSLRSLGPVPSSLGTSSTAVAEVAWNTVVGAFDPLTNTTVVLGNLEYASPAFFTYALAGPLPTGSQAPIYPALHFWDVVDGMANSSVEISLEVSATGGTGPYNLSYGYGSLDTTGAVLFEEQDNFTVVSTCGGSARVVGPGNTTLPNCPGPGWNGSVATLDTVLVPRPEAVYIFGSVTDANGTVGIGYALLYVAPTPTPTPASRVPAASLTSSPVLWGGTGVSAALAFGIGLVSFRTRTARERIEGRDLVRRLRESSNSGRRFE